MKIQAFLYCIMSCLKLLTTEQHPSKTPPYHKTQSHIQNYIVFPLCAHLGRPSHMTHEGDQLASKSLS